VLGGVLDGALELVEERNARRARALAQRQERRLTLVGPGRSSPGSRGNMKL
jgi:hypothetical protein